jgi:hypothetical protein
VCSDSNVAIELACSKLVIGFVEAVDAQDYSRLAELFAPDCTFARPADPETIIAGAPNIIAAFASRPRDRLSLHLCTNILITVESAEAARGSCRVLLFTSNAAEPEVQGKGRKAGASQLIGGYTDRFVKLDAGWRFAERRGRVLFHT